MLMLGIDPGLQCTGWGVVRQTGNRLEHIAHGSLRTSAGAPDAYRLQEIDDGLRAVAADWLPDAAAIEAIFVAKNASSAIKLGMARGVAMQVCSSVGLPLSEIGARQMKKAVTGTGTADKHQIQEMVTRLLGVRPRGADAADALALAIAAINLGPAAQMGAQRAAQIAASPSMAQKGAPAGGGLAAAIAKALAKENSR